MPEPVVALPCGSRSTTSTRRFMATRLAARLTVVVVLPTPPSGSRPRSYASRRPHQDKMAFGVKARYVQRWRRDDFDAIRQRVDLVSRKRALHRDDDAAGADVFRGRFGEGSKIGKCARDHDIEALVRRVILDARRDRAD